MLKGLTTMGAGCRAFAIENKGVFGSWPRMNADERK
jgi:hypothetical protein